MKEENEMKKENDSHIEWRNDSHAFSMMVDVDNVNLLKVENRFM